MRTHEVSRRTALVCAVIATVAWTGGPARAAQALAATPAALAQAMSGRNVVILGEVHDNPEQHALRVAALRQFVASGARPALAFEQFDRDQQAAIDQARKERPRDADYLIAQAKGAPSWDWKLYRPFVELALEYDLPIVAANLSRGEAMKIAMASKASEAPALPASFVAAHEASIAHGHCDLLPAEALPGMARAQIARDRALAEAIRPYAARGVVLLTGNGHGRIDIGVPYWLAADERGRSISIGVLERDADETGEPSDRFDAYVMTAAAARPDPCEDLRKRMGK
jgi:uncharacterized iron-regulated protein